MSQPEPQAVAELTVFTNPEAAFVDHPTYHEVRGCYGASEPVSLREAAAKDARPCGKCCLSFEYVDGQR